MADPMLYQKYLLQKRDENVRRKKKIEQGVISVPEMKPGYWKRHYIREKDRLAKMMAADPEKFAARLVRRREQAQKRKAIRGGDPPRKRRPGGRRGLKIDKEKLQV